MPTVPILMIELSLEGKSCSVIGSPFQHNGPVILLFLHILNFHPSTHHHHRHPRTITHHQHQYISSLQESLNLWQYTVASKRDFDFRQRLHHLSFLRIYWEGVPRQNCPVGLSPSSSLSKNRHFWAAIGTLALQKHRKPNPTAQMRKPIKKKWVLCLTPLLIAHSALVPPK